MITAANIITAFILTSRSIGTVSPETNINYCESSYVYTVYYSLQLIPNVCLASKLKKRLKQSRPLSCDHTHLLVTITGQDLHNYTGALNCQCIHSLHEDPNSLAHAEVNHAHGSYIYTMGILYRKISTWRTKQLVNSRRRYVSTKPVRRFLSQELVEITIF